MPSDAPAPKSPWIYHPDIHPTDHEGFVYLITHLPSNRLYIGKKSVWTRKKGKKAAESNWRNYWSSSKILKQMVKDEGEQNFRREVLQWCPTKRILNYTELEEQVKRDVLRARLPSGQRQYLNLCIMNRYFSDFDTAAR